MITENGFFLMLGLVVGLCLGVLLCKTAEKQKWMKEKDLHIISMNEKVRFAAYTTLANSDAIALEKKAELLEKAEKCADDMGRIMVAMDMEALKDAWKKC
jgi:hypothetical protein